jgi:maltose alpha-D-glucosyltransferase/alpha-amylase
MAVHNFAQEPCTVTLKIDEDEKHLIDLLGDQPYEAIEGTSHKLHLEGYGYRWFRVGSHHL